MSQRAQRKWFGRPTAAMVESVCGDSTRMIRRVVVMVVVKYATPSAEPSWDRPVLESNHEFNEAMVISNAWFLSF
jgi:hypothetical protein